MIEIHNKSTYRRFYNSFTTEFINTYCDFRENGHTAHDSLAAANLSVKNLVETQLENKVNRLNRKTIMQAYTNLKQDATLIKKAIKYYQRMQ